MSIHDLQQFLMERWGSPVKKVMFTLENGERIEMPATIIDHLHASAAQPDLHVESNPDCTSNA